MGAGSVVAAVDGGAAVVVAGFPVVDELALVEVFVLVHAEIATHAKPARIISRLIAWSLRGRAVIRTLGAASTGSAQKQSISKRLALT